MSQGNGVRMRWTTVGTIIGVLLTLATLFGTGMVTWGTDRQRLMRLEKDVLQVQTDLREHLRQVAEAMPKMVEARNEIQHISSEQVQLRADIQSLATEQRELTRIYYGMAKTMERYRWQPNEP